MQREILAPVVALVAWTLVMLGWMMAMRMPAMRAAGIDMGKLTGSKGSDADKVLPPQAQWKAHNYNHLHEQPTLFYAISITLAVLDKGHGIALWLAWAYVILRIAHSLVQATFNKVSTRFALFVLSTAALAALTVCAGLALAMDAATPGPIVTTAAAYPH
ncbi:MAPEG family protein [Sphingomonas sp. KR3-1]|uniref:MAPEG family protein n=1 Tax=Sphingomonas sp. KR3-1 TaxID=3156611 RepID=UPI0032B32F2C